MLSLAPVPVGLVGLAGHLKRHPLPDPGVISDEMRREARATWAALRGEHGFRAEHGALLTPPDANAKIKKSARAVWSLTLSPAMSQGQINTCVRYADCVDVCVLTAGKGALPVVQRSRNARTALLYRAPEAFAILLADEIDKAGRLARRDGFTWGLRPNAASDIPWEIAAPWLLERVANLGGRSYDYTKAWSRTGSDLYSITRSVDSRQSVEEIRDVLANGDNVAVILPVKKGHDVPSTWQGLPAIDGDVSDARCDDPRGVVVILRAKGKLRGVPSHPMVRAL